MKSKRILLLIVLFICTRPLSGQFNPAFGNSGKLDFTVDVYDQPAEVAPLPGDKFALLSWCGSVTGTQFDADVVLTVFHAGGSQDNAFGTNGQTRFDFAGMDYSTARSLERLPDGKWLVMGSGYPFADPSQAPVCLARLNADGSADTTFGNGGSIFIHFYEQAEFPGALLAKDTLLYLCGASYDTLGNHNVPVAGRFDVAAQADSSFGGTGKLVIDFISGLQHLKTDHLVGGEAYDLVVAADGSVFICGSYGANAFLTKLTPEGKFDSTFAMAGHYIFQAAPLWNSRAEKLLLLPDGSLLMAVGTDESPGQDFYLYRLDADDGSFLNSAAIDFSAHENEFADFALLPGGAVLLAGRSTLPSHLGVAGYRSDFFALATVKNYATLAPDWSAEVEYFSGVQCGAHSLAVLENGDVICAGFTQTAVAGNTDIVLLGLSGDFLTGLSAASGEKELIKIWPQPADDFIYFSVEGKSGAGERYMLTIVSPEGKVVFAGETEGGKAVPVEMLSAGVYGWRLAEKSGWGKVFSGRLVKE